MNEAKRFLTIAGLLAVVMIATVGILSVINWNTIVGGFLLVLIATTVIWLATGDSI